MQTFKSSLEEFNFTEHEINLICACNHYIKQNLNDEDVNEIFTQDNAIEKIHKCSFGDDMTCDLLVEMARAQRINWWPDHHALNELLIKWTKYIAEKERLGNDVNQNLTHYKLAMSVGRVMDFNRQSEEKEYNKKKAQLKSLTDENHLLKKQMRQKEEDIIQFITEINNLFGKQFSTLSEIFIFIENYKNWHMQEITSSQNNPFMISIN